LRKKKGARIDPWGCDAGKKIKGKKGASSSIRKVCRRTRACARHTFKIATAAR